MSSDLQLIEPRWPAPPNVHALQTTRLGGVSPTPYDSLNLGDHVGDQASHVAANRQSLSQWLPSEPLWMRQEHGTEVVDAATAGCLPEADAAFARLPNTVCTVMTADCLPVLLCDRQGTVVAAVHAGWRGLLGGVIERTFVKMQCSSETVLAWLGPAIGPEAFEVGKDVYQAFVAQDVAAHQAFVPGHEGKWLADLYALARLRLNRLGISAVFGGDFCTYSDSARFFSYRRDGRTGRMASMIWLAML